MAGIVVCGAGPIGPSAALLLARAGHEVEACEAWDRSGVAQFRQPHTRDRRPRAAPRRRPAAVAGRPWCAARRRSPFHRQQVRSDDARIAEMTGLARRGEPRRTDPLTGSFGAAAMRDADVFRALLETTLCLTPPEEVLARPGPREKIDELGGAEPLRLPGPDRGRLLELVRS